MEGEFRRTVVSARQPDEYWAKVEHAVQQVRSDPVTMAELRESVHDDMLNEAQEALEQ